MTKIIVVGHEFSNYQIIEKLLHTCGMASALPSKRESMSAIEIDAALSKVNIGVPNQKALSDGHVLRQLQVSPIWNGLAMDLFLGNINQSLWGWADSQALPLLNYWRDMDESVYFALVYEQPHSILINNQRILDQDSIERKLQEWVDYNESLLQFYLNNQNRCLLVHSRQARLSSSSYVRQLHLHIEAPWPELSKDKEITDAWGGDNTAIQMVREKDWQLESTQLNQLDEQSNLAYFLADFMIKSHPKAIQLYEELQAIANLPLHETEHLQASNHTASIAWQEMVQKNQLLDKQIITNQQQEKKLDKLEDISIENELLLQQLHSTQEELERIYLNRQQVEVKLNFVSLEKQEILHKNNELEQIKRKDDEAIQKLEIIQLNLEQEKNNLEKIKIHLEEQQSKLKQEKIIQLNEKEKENNLLLEQLHYVQEELERLFLENQRLNSDPIYYGAAERVRNQLDYRLGAAMIQGSKSISGWLSMPFALMKENKKTTPNEVDLPPISLYQDAHEAEKIQNHLSYRLGKTWLKNRRTLLGWLSMPWALNKTIKEFRKKK